MTEPRTTAQAHSDHIALHDSHRSMPMRDFETIEKYVLYLMHVFPYARLSRAVAGRAVLDLGCNNGYGSEILAHGGASVTGVDVAHKVIDEARARVADQPIRFVTFDGLALPFDDLAFDVVVSCQVIEHVVDRNAYLREIARVLSPDGYAMFTTPNRRIRLDPGMTPWNRFHVTEFDAAQLGETLRGQFDAVAVRGMFGSDPVHRVEVDRVEARRRAKRAQDFASMTGRPIGRVPQADRRSGATADGLAAYMAAHTIDDLRWQSGACEDALDLLAIGARDPRIVSQALVDLGIG